MATVAPLPEKGQCAICKTETGLSSCKGCLVVFYCGRDHHKEDWSNHKRLCKDGKLIWKTNWEALEHMKPGRKPKRQLARLLHLEPRRCTSIPARPLHVRPIPS